MKHNKNNHWVEEMTVGETIYIDFQELQYTHKGNPYIIAKHNNETIYANVGRWDEELFKAGHTYSMTCTKCDFNQNTKHNYLQYKFEEVLTGTTNTGKPRLVQDTVESYLESTSVDDDEEYLHQHHLERLLEMEARKVGELEAIRYAIRKCNE